MIYNCHKIHQEVMEMLLTNVNLYLAHDELGRLIDDMISQFIVDEPSVSNDAQISSFTRVMRKFIRHNLIEFKIPSEYRTADFPNREVQHDMIAEEISGFFRNTNLRPYMSISTFLRSYSFARGLFRWTPKNLALFLAPTDIRILLNQNQYIVGPLFLEAMDMLKKTSDARCCHPFEPGFLHSLFENYLDNENPDYQENADMLKMALISPDIGFAIAISAFCKDPLQAWKEMKEMPDGDRIKRALRVYLNDFKIQKMLLNADPVRSFLIGREEEREDPTEAFLTLLK
jgi:hypothetical protein